MAQGIIEGFDYNEFAMNLSGQASQVVPADISEADKKFVITTVHQFCVMSGEALANDQSVSLTADEASLIVQFIGEWSFHKAVDLIRGNVSPNLREGILQRVAFTVFEVAKLAVTKRMPNEQIIPLVEHHVTKCFTEAIEDLKQKGAIDESAAQQAISQSNVDAMAQAQVAEEADDAGAEMSDTKILKLASLALLIKNFPMNKIESILKKLNRPEAEVLLQYLKMPDLENKIDMNVAARYLEDMKNKLPQPTTVSLEKCFLKLCKIVKNSDKNRISNIIKDERPMLREFVLSPYSRQEVVLPAKVAAVVCKYLEQKIAS
jgi:hypothetical protein